MNEKIAALIRLQEFDSQLEAIAQSKAKLGPQRDQVRADIQGLQTRVEESKKAYQQAQVDKKNLELDIDAKDQAVRKSSGELNSAKSNEVYKALLAQIEEAKKAKSAIEDKVLEVMEQIEALQRDAKEAEKRSQQDKAAFEAKIGEIDAEEKRLGSEHDAKKAERDQYAQSLSADVRAPYELVQRGPRRGPIVVAIRGDICGCCQTKLTRSVVNEVMKGHDIVFCETCSRILHIPAAPVASAPPA